MTATSGPVQVVPALREHGYRHATLLRAGPVCDVFTARRGGARVIVKLLRPGRPDHDTACYWARSFRREGEYLRAWADIDGLVRAVVVNETLPIASGTGAGTAAFHVMHDAGSDLEGRRVHPAEAVSIMTGVAATIAAVHERGFVHRDVKPANILASERGVVLGDLGTAAPIDGRHRGHFRRYLYPYTPLFAAPELFAGFGVEDDTYPAADVWSIGTTLVSLCADVQPMHVLLGPAERAALVRSFGRLRGRLAREQAFQALQPVLLERLAELLHGVRREWRPTLGAAGSARLVDVLAALLAIDPQARPDAAAAHRHLAELHPDHPTHFRRQAS